MNLLAFYFRYVCLLVLFSITQITYAAPDWTVVEKLIKEQKIKQASTRIDRYLKNEKQEKDNLNWRQALILGATFRHQRSEHEKAVNYLENQPWPQDHESMMLINLHKAYILKGYIERYRWEIQNREKISTKNSTVLKKKTMKQLVHDTNQAFAKSYFLAVKNNIPLNKFTLPLPSIKHYFILPDYPPHIRGSIRETVSYLWADFLADSSLWNASHSNQKSFSLDYMLSRLKGIKPENSRRHPLKRAMKLLDDLERFQITKKNPEAALEAFRTRIMMLSRYDGNQLYKQQLIKAMRSRIDKSSSLPWLNMLRADLARLLDNPVEPEANIQRVAVLKKCLALHKKHRATTFCKKQLDELLQPSIQLSGMKSDGLKKRSLLINHNNVNKVYFRAWRINFEQLMQNKTYQQMQDLLLKSKRKPDAQWQLSLPPGKDYRSHKTFVTPPIQQYGYWLIAASVQPDFSIRDKKNIVVSTALNITRLVATTQGDGDTLSVRVFNGETGQIASKVRAELWTQNYNKPSRLISTAYTSNQGKANLKISKNNSVNLVLKYDKDFTLVNNLYGFSHGLEREQKSALVFTDRAIYRPAQKILWKVVAYKGNAKTGNYTVFPNNQGWVKLFDANNKLVQHTTVKTNEYGSGSGEFTIKTGLLLGNWRIATSWGGSQLIKVEEYKRPTFTVKIQDSERSLGLNKPAQVTGSAKYYFGQAVTEGSVNWQVKRLPVDLWRYGGRGGHIDALTIASGSSKVDSTGKFTLNFVPKPAGLNQMQGLDKKPLQYTFEITAELTDSGGETRKATRKFSIGKLGILADISAKDNFGMAGKPYQLTVSRHDLDGSPRAGNAYWEVYQIRQPATPIMPNDLPVTGKQANSKYATKGDKIMPRWTRTEPSLESTVKDWKDAQKVQQGALKHDKSGNAALSLKGLGAGLYRLRYTSKDQWGQVYKTQKTFVVAHKNKKTVESPALLMTQINTVEVGGKVDLLLGSAFKQTPILLEIFHGNKLLRQSIQTGGIKQLQFPVSQEHRGGLSFVLTLVKDYQLIRKKKFVDVPWTDKNLNVSFSTFRDKLQPGQKEKWRITLKNSKDKTLEKGAAEVLASMYDRSLDLFVKHNPASVTSLYSQQPLALNRNDNLGVGSAFYIKNYSLYAALKAYRKARLRLMTGGGQVLESAPVATAAPAPRPSPVARSPQTGRVDVYALQRKLKPVGYYKDYSSGALKRNMKIDSAGNELSDSLDNLDTIETRTNFNETAFFYPHLVLEENGSVAFEFEVPESLTQWKVWVSALTKDLRGGSATEYVRTSKELMVRPYLPRFLRAGDRAHIEVLVNNTGEKALNGKLDFDVLDAETLKSINTDFKLANNLKNFNVDAGKSSRLRFSVVAPKDLGMVAIRARASASNGAERFADGEQRPLPVLPSRIHLSQSRFAALQGNTSKKLTFKQLAANDDNSRINDKLVVTVDGQLFYSTLKALPYLVDYPYECTEQTLNRFLSTSIVNSVFEKHPAIASMAKKMAQRKSQYEKWDSVDKDPNHKMLLEETPWLNQAEGGSKDGDKLIRVLDPQIAKKQYQKALRKLQKAQTASGGFPWWEGGSDSPYMTAYLLHGFSRALEFKIDIPKDMVKKAWHYLDKHYQENLKAKNKDNIYEITLINYVLSAYPDESWAGKAFSAKDRKNMLDYSFKRWRELPTMLKAYLALTLKRAGRSQDAMLVFDSIMDLVKTDDELGTYWAPEDRSWLWYNDSIDTHAFMLRTMMELNPADQRRHGLVQWLMLNKKLSHWKSTRATAESIYSLVHYLKQEDQLSIVERAKIQVGNHLNKTLVFKPDEYTGAKNQLVVEAENIKPDMSNIIVTNQSKSLMFASASWHFSTEKLPERAEGDFFTINRKFFKRILKGKEWELQPLAEGASVAIGDQLEVQLSLRAKHAAEYVHLRAPRGAGFEPEKNKSGYRWQTGLGYYEEIRDSGANYFFERLPVGEFTFKYRLRSTTAGQFRVAPATVQSIYAPEFNAYSSGIRLQINPEGKK